MLTAAAQAMDAEGYSGFTVAQVIARAKVSRKTFYEAFADREDCLVELLDMVVREVDARMSTAYARESSWRDGTRSAMFELLRFMDDEPLLARVCVVHALAAGPRVLRRRAEVLASLRDFIVRGSGPAKAGADAPSMVAEGVLGGVFAVLHTRMIEGGAEPFVDLLGALMSIVVLPYLGPRAASAERARSAPARATGAGDGQAIGDDPLEGLDIRLTQRTVRVLSVVGRWPGSSNREVGEHAEIVDAGQTSKLLGRLQRLELVENTGDGRAKGGSNAWRLTERGKRVERASRPR
jgi:AcrR family transcriptional regulator